MRRHGVSKKVLKAISQAEKLGRSKLPNPNSMSACKIQLHVRKGVTAKGNVSCTVCGQSYGIMTRYRESNVGPVILCTTCKVKVFEVNFGHADAMPLKVDHAHAWRD